jgi:GNAT superfamily N-acetyltransferase
VGAGRDDDEDREGRGVKLRSIRVTFAPAAPEDAAALAALHAEVARRLTERFDRGAWSSAPSEKSVLSAIRTSRVFVARRDDRIVATYSLATKKPWAIDVAYFTACRQPIYLLSMAVDPEWQRRGIGRLAIDDALAGGRRLVADAVRLDAYDAEAGAGPFYAKCGFREVGRVVYRRTPLVYFERLL